METSTLMFSAIRTTKRSSFTPVTVQKSHPRFDIGTLFQTLIILSPFCFFLCGAIKRTRGLQKLKSWAKSSESPSRCGWISRRCHRQSMNNENESTVGSVMTKGQTNNLEEISKLGRDELATRTDVLNGLLRSLCFD